MKELVLTLLILVIVFVPFAIIAFIICKIMFFWIDKNNREFEEKHPDYIKFKNKYNELLQESMNIWNSTMPDKRKEVDKFQNARKNMKQKKLRFMNLLKRIKRL